MNTAAPIDARDVLAAMPDGVVVVGADQRITFVNPRAARLIGAPVGDLVGHPAAVALPLMTPGGHAWWECLDPWAGLATRTGHRERMLRLPGQGELLVTMSFVRPVRTGPVERVIVVLRDTEQRRRSEAGTAELLSIVAHELRSPLSSIRGFSGTLLRRWGRFTEEQKRLMVETIEADSRRLSRLLNELLDVSRLDSSRLRVVARPLDLREVITGHVDRLVAAGHDRGRFVWSEAGGGRREVWADADRLDQILANLIENALRHGSGRVTVATEEVGPAGDSSDDLTATGGYVTVTVTDEGEGIEPELYPLIFEKFWHGSARGSTGLGLYLVRGLVEAHGGRVDVDRAPSGGALFRFTLPRVPPDHLA